MSSKITKKRLSLCKDKSEKLSGLLNDKKTQQVDVTEFVCTMKFVTCVLEEFIKTKDKERPTVSDEGAKIELILREYEEIINSLFESGRFVRFFTSNRIRRKLDGLNTQLFKEVNQINLALQSAKKKSSSKRKDSENYLETISDVEGRELWATNFGPAMWVEWKDFTTALGKYIQIDEEANKHLQYTLDYSNTGFISIFKFNDFLTGFGPLRQCVTKTQNVLKADWFHGFLSSIEAERLLERQPTGTYLIRFSKSKPGSFAIAYVDGVSRNAVTHTLITSSPPNGFRIDEQYNERARGRLFATVQEVLDSYAHILQVAFKSDLSKETCFHGDLSSQEAEDLLRSEMEGTYLFRFSAKAGFLAVSYVQRGAVKHGLLEAVPGGYKLENQREVYTSLKEVVDSMQGAMVNPYSNLSFEVKKSVTMTMNSLNRSYSNFIQPANENYGALPVGNSPVAKPASGGTSYGSLHSVAPSPPTVRANAPRGPSEYTGIPPQTPQQPPSPNASLYGRMPAPAPSPSNTGVSNYSAIPARGTGTVSSPGVTGNSGGSNYSSIPGRGTGSAIARTPSATNLNNTATAPDQGGSSLYGKMPVQQAKPTSPSFVQPEPDNQYSSMPVNRPKVIPNNNLYGPIATPNSPNKPPDNYGVLPGNKSTSTPASNYGSINTFKAAPLPPVPAPTQRPVSSYGKTAPQEYTAFQMPVKGDYAGLSALGITPNDDYGALAPQPATNDDYCALPSKPTTTQNLVNEDYGALPIPKGANSGQDYGSLPSIGGNSDYGSLPSASPNRNSVIDNSEYGALPETGGRFGVKPSAHRLGSSGKLSVHRSPNQ